MNWSEGWVKNWRKIKYTSWYKMPLVAHLAQHIVREVCKYETTIYVCGEKVRVASGQLLTGRKKLAQETGLSERNIRTGLKVLVVSGFITLEATKRYTLITVCNYEIYQSVDSVSDQGATKERPSKSQKATREATKGCDDVISCKEDRYGLVKSQGDQGHDQAKKCQGSKSDHITRRQEDIIIKEKINKKEKTQYSSNFEKIWARYPVPIGKKVAWRHYKQSVKDQDDYDAINMALDIYLATDRVKNGIIQNGSTWFNNWRDYLELAQRQTQETTSKPSIPAQDDRKVQTQRFEQFIRQARSLQDIADYILDNTEWEQDYYDAIEKKKGLKALANIKRIVIGQRQQLTAELRAVTANIAKEM